MNTLFGLSCNMLKYYASIRESEESSIYLFLPSLGFGIRFGALAALTGGKAWYTELLSLSLKRAMSCWSISD